MLITKLEEIHKKTLPSDVDISAEAVEYRGYFHDKRSYYSVAIWTLLKGKALSLPLFKCFVYHFMNEFEDVFKEFIVM